MGDVLALGAAVIVAVGQILRIGEITVRAAVRRHEAGGPAPGHGRAVSPADGQAGAAVGAASVASKTGRER
ncbi:hypothetical protein [Actinomadura rubrisoli]|uniref:Uncharacterized protein n=1 Tax=Actinomadura rubrisoli TaxID=2530368 RepID=A0A4R4ZTI0_9ACTN|nr:hypothetical protein [Actinomadura rubrisoli]TDD61424.1 hypothetical protein E1298_45395 [Actinomadura rubrisoli]